MPVLTTDPAKVVLLGPCGVGKTSIWTRFATQKPLASLDTYKATIGCDFMMRPITIKDKEIPLLVWDTQGMERYNGVCKSYFHGMEAGLLVYDVSKPDSLDQLIEWYTSAKDFLPEVPLLIVGNKTDKEAVVPAKRAANWAAEQGHQFVECSALKEESVLQVFTTTAELILNNRIKSPKARTNAFGLTVAPQAASKGCC
ncbi:Rab18 family GTPase [Pelomyxa schiedti]|nr:Rab18 family GTPase [Pelomyxa schiedti]